MTIYVDDIKNLRTTWPLPKKKKKIVIIGAGGIVKDAHLPAYQKGGFKVHGIYDTLTEEAVKCANTFNIERVYRNLDEALSEKETVFDIAVPPSALLSVVAKLPKNSICQLQKPLGSNLIEARQIAELIAKNHITACVNLQLKFSPMMLALKEAIEKKMIGKITDLEVNLSVSTPWQLWPFMEKLDYVEVPLHSIHYIDWIISILGKPLGVYCKSVKHPNFPRMKDARSTIILDYEQTRCCLSLNHTHDTRKYGLKHSHAYAKVEGLNGAAYIKLGLLLNYPNGEPEEIEITTENLDWTLVDNVGKWFPDAFLHSMSCLQRYVSLEENFLPHSIANSLVTMSVVHACLESSKYSGVKIPI